MPSRKKSVNTALILVVLFVLFMGAKTRGNHAAQGTGLQSEAAPYGIPGPHLVGTGELAIKGEAQLEIKMWYPAVNDDNQEETITYPYEIKLDAPFSEVAIASFEGQAIREARYDLSASPYPLVILSPGFSIGSSSYAWLAEHLASYGFVVISPDHPEHLDPANELWRAAITRPQDILTVLAYVDEQAGSGGAFEGWIDRDLVAVIGHSYGGYTALAAAGARVDTGSFEAHCKRSTESKDPSAWLCDELLPHLADMAGLAGLESIPEGQWPAWADPRVDAIVPMAGDAFFFGQVGLAEISVPVMAIGGTADSDSPFMWGTHPTYEYASSSKKVRIALNEAEHMIFTGPCEKNPWFLKFFPNEFCSDPSWDRDYAHGLVNHFVTAFFLAELKQDASAAAALGPEGVDFPGVTYDAQGY